MEKKVLRHEQGTDLADMVNDLRRTLADKKLYFGALFVGQATPSGTTFGLLFADDMPQSMRMDLLHDLQIALDAAKESFRQ